MKNLYVIMFAIILCLSTVSCCNIASSRPNKGTVTVVLEGIPDNVGAVSIWCTANDWKADNVNGSSQYVVKTSNGTAKFVLNDYVLSVPLQFQFTPMPSADTKMGDDWWSYAISGSSQYAKNKNNITCDFTSKGGYDGCTVTVNADTYPDWKSDESNFPVYGINSSRWFTDKYDKCFKVE